MKALFWSSILEASKWLSMGFISGYMVLLISDREISVWNFVLQSLIIFLIAVALIFSINRKIAKVRGGSGK